MTKGIVKKDDERLFGSWSPPATLMGQDEESQKLKDEEKYWLEHKDVPSATSGGTAHILPRERAKASFDTLKLTLVLDGNDPKQTVHRRWLWAAGEDYDNSHNVFRSREEMLSEHVERFINMHKKHIENGYQPNPQDIMTMTNASRNQGGFGLHFGAFLQTIAGQGTTEQVMEFAIPAFTFGIVGCLCQTELSHGSNVRGLQTTATYDRETEEFVISTPTLGASKIWPGNGAKTANFCVVYANLIIDGKEYGFHSFVMQLRDENHMPLPGIELYEAGPKIGDNGTETIVMRIHDVRIPRTWMLAKNQVVQPDGTYEKKTKMNKAQGLTMIGIRSGLVMGAGYRLAQGVVCTTRYSCVRLQGFKDTTVDGDRFAEERQIIDYQNQQHRLFKQLATAYAFIFTGKSIGDKFQKVMQDVSSDDASDLPELHGTSSGLKALCTFEGSAGLEECRKLMGGHGVLLAAGVGQMYLDYLPYYTAEGDGLLLELQSARYLLKCLDEAKRGETVKGLTEYLNDCNVKPDLSRSKAQSSESFKDLDLLNDLFRARALCTVTETHEEFSALIKQGKKFDEAWNACAVDLVRCSRVHCYYTLLHNFTKEVRNVKDEPVRRALTAVCQLYGLINLSEDLGSFDFTNAQKRHIRSAMTSLLPIIRNDAVALTDAFEFPDNVLNSALGRHDGKVYESLFHAAKVSPLNKHDPFIGFKEHLEPHLDKDFLREHKVQQRAGSPASKL